MNLAPDKLNEMTWRWALVEARKGDAAPLLKLLVDQAPLPENLRVQVKLAVDNPVSRKSRTGPQRKFSESQARQIREMHEALTDSRGGFKMTPGAARVRLAEKLGTTECALRDVIERKKAYAVKPA